MHILAINQIVTRTQYFVLFANVFEHCGFLGSNDKSVIVWDVKGDLDLNAKIHDSSEVSVVTIITEYRCVVCVEFTTIIMLLIIQ